MRLIRINTPHVVEQLVLRDIQFNACLPTRLAVTVLYANDTVSRMWQERCKTVNRRPYTTGVKPAFHGACFGAVSAPTLSARVPRGARAAFEKERFHYEHSSCFHGADCRAD